MFSHLSVVGEMGKDIFWKFNLEFLQLKVGKDSNREHLLFYATMVYKVFHKFPKIEDQLCANREKNDNSFLSKEAFTRV